MKSNIKFCLLLSALPITFILSCNSADDKAGYDTTGMGNDTVAKTTTPIIVAGDSSRNDSTAKPGQVAKAKKGKVTIMIPPNPLKEEETEIFPQFPGGQAALDKYIAANVVYPEEALEEGIEGTVTVNFSVDKLGMIYTPHVIGPKLGHGLEVEAMKVINKMPLWTPGRIKGKNAKTNYTLPIQFQLER